jgi:lipoate-protein ligase B
MGYHEAWEIQRTCAEQRLNGEIPDTLLLLEHPPTLTLGRSANPENLLATPQELMEEGFALVESDRGGDITYHGDGQLVGYPILNLREPPHNGDLHQYLRNLEEVLIQTLKTWDIHAERFPGYTGVWVDRHTSTPAKIAAIGVKASRWITQHGFALNVTTNLSHFQKIVPCGIRDYGVTSLEQILQQPLALEEVLPPVIEAFGEVFGYQMEEVSTLPVQK